MRRDYAHKDEGNIEPNKAAAPPKVLESIAPVAFEEKEEQVTELPKVQDKNLLPWTMAVSTLGVVLIGTVIVLARHPPRIDLGNVEGPSAAAAPIEAMERTPEPPLPGGIIFNEKSIPPTPEPPPQPFDEIAAAQAADRAESDAADCLPPRLGQVSMKVNITFASTGSVSNVLAIGPDSLSPQMIRCVESAFSTVRIGTFQEKEVTLQKTFLIH